MSAHKPLMIVGAGEFAQIACEYFQHDSLWSGNHISHRTVVQDNAFIASHAVIPGYCQIGRSSFIGVNATLSDRVCVAADNIIGAGALVTRHTEAERVYVGSPARAAAGKSSFDVEL